MFVSMLGDATKTLLHIALAPVRIRLALFYMPHFDNMQRRYFFIFKLISLCKDYMQGIYNSIHCSVLFL